MRGSYKSQKDKSVYQNLHVTTFTWCISGGFCIQTRNPNNLCVNLQNIDDLKKWLYILISGRVCRIFNRLICNSLLNRWFKEISKASQWSFKFVATMQSFTCVRCKYQSKINYGVLKNEVFALNSLHLQDTFLWYAGLLKNLKGTRLFWSP